MATLHDRILAEISVWDAGGIRAGAAGRPRRILRCEQCGRRRWHEIYKPA